MAYGFTPQVDSTVARECSIVWQVDCDGGGGPGPGPTGKRVYWGNWQSPVPATFTETQFTNPASAGWANNIGGYNTENKLVRDGTYEFSVPPVGPDWFQIYWFPNSLLAVVGNPLHITVSGFTFNLQPLPDTAYQSLTIDGVPGKVFVSANSSNGGFTNAGGNSMQVS